MAPVLLRPHLLAALTLTAFFSGISTAVGSTGKLLQIDVPSSNKTIGMSSNATSSSRSRLSRSISYYTQPGDDGGPESCVGPTPPPGLTFPIETVVEKIFEVDGPTTELVWSCDSKTCFSTKSTYTAAATSYSTWTRQQKPQLDPYDFQRPCCGMCTVYVSLVDVYYWPVSEANTACLGSTAVAITGEAQSSTISKGHNGTAVTAVGPDGFTYSSPSIYVAYHDISASNRCSQLGPKHTSITLSFAPGELSTLDYFSNIFEGPFYESAKPFNISHLPCPPQSLLDAQNDADGIGFMLPARPQYAPIIAPPLEIQNLEPAWKWCHSQMAFDPPRSLVPAAILVPSPTPAAQAGLQKTPAAPSPTLDPIPVQTQLGNQAPTVHPPGTPNDPTDPADPRLSSDDSPQPPNGNPINPPDPSTLDPAARPQNDVDQGKTSSSNIDSPNNQGDSPGLSNNPSTQPDPYPGGPELSSNPSLDGTIKSQPTLATPVITVGDQTLTALPKGGYSIADTTIRPNDPAITVHGTPISLGDSVLVVGPTTLSLGTGNANAIHIAGGVKYTQLDPGTILLDGNTLSVDGPAAIVSGNTVSLGSTGIVIAGKTFAFSTPAPELIAPNTLTIAGQLMTQLGNSAVIVDGVTLSFNGVGQTVHGTVLSLASSGIVINGQTYNLPTPEPFASGVVIAGPTVAFSTPAPEVMAPSTLTISGQTLTQLGDSRVLIDGVTLSVNGVAKQVHGTVLSLASTGIVINGQTYSLPTPAPDVVPRPDGTFTIADQTVRLLGSSSAIIDGKLISVNGPVETVSGKIISLASSGIIVNGQSYAFPSLPVKTTSNAVVIGGTTLVAGGPAIAISGTTLSLVSGSTGLYLAGVGMASSAISMPVTAEASMTMDPSGKLVDAGSADISGGGADGGGFGSLIMLGIGQGGVTSASSSGGAASDSNATSTPGLVAFMGTANRALDSCALFSACLALFWGLLAVL